MREELDVFGDEKSSEVQYVKYVLLRVLTYLFLMSIARMLRRVL